MKKVIAKFIVVVILSTLFNGLNFSLTTFASAGVVVYEEDFEHDMGNWEALNGVGVMSRTTEFAYSGSYSLKLSDHNITWMSPSINLYSIIKNHGAGTYHFSIRAMYEGGYDDTYQDTYMMIRGKSSRDENSFIECDIEYSGDYFKRISSPQNVDERRWKLITGSVKVLDSDIARTSGNFILCLDGLPDASNIDIYIDAVKIVKFDEEEITNGDFSAGVDGWRSWSETEVYGNHLSQESISGETFGKYLRIETYGSIATNVDQILSYYGSGKYTLSFKIRVEQASDENEPFTFYLSSNFSNYHKWIGQKKISEDSSWITLSYTFEISEYEFMNQLRPDEKEVHFRIQAPAAGISEYCLKDVELCPLANNNFSIAVDTGTNPENGSVAKCNVVNASPLNAPSRVMWESSNESIATIDRNGYVYAKRRGTITITATSRSGNLVKTINYNVLMPNYEVPNFVQVQCGQEDEKQCWAACVKMITKYYLLSEGTDTMYTTGTLEENLVSAGLETGKTANDAIDNKRETLFNYYTNNVPTGAVLLDINCDTECPTVDEIITALYNNVPFEIQGNSTSGGHAVVAYGFYYDDNNNFMLKVYDPAKNNNTGGNDAWSYAGLVGNGSGSDGYEWTGGKYVSTWRYF